LGKEFVFGFELKYDFNFSWYSLYFDSDVLNSDSYLARWTFEEDLLKLIFHGGFYLDVKQPPLVIF